MTQHYRKYQSKIEQLVVKHFSRRNLTGDCAKMSLWAETELGHQVWLLTKYCLDTRRVDAKVEEMEKDYKFMLGREIPYVLKFRDGNEDVGFIMPKGIDLEVYRQKTRAPKPKPEYMDIGAGI
jgi:hypothetical protein